MTRSIVADAKFVGSFIAKPFKWIGSAVASIGHDGKVVGEDVESFVSRLAAQPQKSTPAPVVSAPATSVAPAANAGPSAAASDDGMTLKIPTPA